MVNPLALVASFFNISSSWLEFPNIITFVIVPLFVLMWFFKILIYEKIRIFKNEFAAWILGVFLSLLMTFVLKVGNIGAMIGVVGIIWFKVNNILLRIILTIIIILVLINLNTITSLIAKNI